MVDGLDNNDPIVGAVRATFSQEAIREFQVLTNSYSGRVRQGLRRRRRTSSPRAAPTICRGNAFVLLPRRRAERQGPLREGSTSFGDADQPREGAVRPDPVGRHPRRPDPEGQDLLLRGRSSGWTSTPTTSSTSTRTPATCSRANGFPVELGNVPYSDRHDRAARQDRPPVDARARCARDRANVLRHHQREHRALRRARGARAAAPLCCATTLVARRRRRRDVLARDG